MKDMRMAFRPDRDREKESRRRSREKLQDFTKHISSCRVGKISNIKTPSHKEYPHIKKIK